MKEKWKDYVEHYEMISHPEGGFYKELYRSTTEVEVGQGKGFYSAGTHIYYLLRSGEFSAFHQIRFDELWHFYSGDSLRIHSIDLDGMYQSMLLGEAFDANCAEFHCVPGGHWFAVEPVSSSRGFSFVGCTVVPGFEFEDFHMASFDKLRQKFPQHEDLFRRLCK